MSKVCHLAPCGCISPTRIDLPDGFSYRRSLLGAWHLAPHASWRIRMKRIVTIAALIMFAATPPPAVAQWAGMPVWNNPKGGTGVTVDGDLGFPNSAGKSGTAFGARATLGLANISFTAGVSSWKPSGYSQSLTSETPAVKLMMARPRS